MRKTVAIITVSDKGSKGLREDLARPAIESVINAFDFEVVYTSIIPDEKEEIKQELLKCVNNKISLILTTGGTGFSKRDVTPEASLEVVEKLANGIPEAMRLASLKYTDRAMLSRGVCGIKDDSIILNLPGSPKAAKENLESVIKPLIHGIETLLGEASECAR